MHLHFADPLMHRDLTLHRRVLKVVDKDLVGQEKENENSSDGFITL